MVSAHSSATRIRGTIQGAVLFIAGLLILLLPASELYGQNVSDPEELFREAETLFIFNELERAKELYQQITEEHCDDSPRICAESWLQLSIISRYNRDFEESARLQDIAEERAETALDEGDSFYVKVYAQRAYLFEDKTLLEEARYWADKTVEFAEEHALPEKPTARASIINGYIHSAEGNYQEAISMYTAALEKLSDLPGDIYVMRLLSQIHNNIGIVYRRTGEPEKALHHYELASEVIKEALGDTHHEMALIYNNMGGIYYGLGDRGKAAEYFIRSASILIENFGENNNRVAIAYNNAGISYLQLGEIDTAFRYLELSQQIKVNIHGEDHPETAVGYNNLASYYLQMGQFENAEENYLRSIEIRRNVYGENHPDLIAPKLSISRLYIQTERFGMAREQLNRALTIGLQRFRNNHPDIIDIYGLIAGSYYEQGNIDLAGEYYSQAINYITDSDISDPGFSVDLQDVTYPVKLIENISGKSRVLKARYEVNESRDELIAYLRLTGIASEIIDELQTSFQSEASKLSLLDTHYGIYAGALDVLYELYAADGDKAWLDEMITFSERSKSRIALELLQDVEARRFGGIPEEVLARERELNEQVAVYLQQVNLHLEKNDEGEAEALRLYRDSLFYAQRNLDNFTRSLESEYPAYYRLKYDRRIADRKDIQAMVEPGESIIAYAFGEKALYAIVIDRENVGVGKIENGDELTESIRALRQAVISSNTSDYLEKARSLYVQLIGPLENHLMEGALTILPDQVLHYLPFELLLTEDPAQTAYHRLPYLIRSYEISYSPSATVMMSKMNSRPADPRNLLALAPFNDVNIGTVLTDDASTSSEVSRYLNQLAPLPLTGFEAREIAKLFRERTSIQSFFFPEQAEVLTDRRASRSRVMEGRLDDYGFIHFATHAFINERYPALSGIALHPGSGDDGIVYLNEIYNLQMNADLVVLGACDTGLGELHRGEGIIGFTRAFFYAGASNLVVSMWKVNDQPTAHLMIDFYRHIRNGEDYSSALRNAKLNLISHPEYAAPRNWAAFVLMGR
jgi:CHAT domain-containing protein/Tfp pilus assembly protein PilF